MDGRGPTPPLAAVVELTTCVAPPQPTEDEPELYEPLFQATVTDEQGGQDDRGQDVFSGGFAAGGLEWGDPAVVGRLRDSACPLRQQG